MTIQSDHTIMNILKVTELRHLIAHTNLGELTLMLRKGETEYRFILDAVPVSNEQNKELLTLYFPPKIIVPTIDKETIKTSIKTKKK